MLLSPHHKFLFPRGPRGGFNPLSYPALLFAEARTGVENGQGLGVDIDPAYPASLDIITATNSGGTVMDADGDIVAATANTVRVDHSLGYPAILCEPEVEQLINYTDFSSGWLFSSPTSGGGYKGFPSKVFTAGSANVRYTAAFSSVEGVTYTFSIYIRRLSGSGVIYAKHDDSSSGGSTVITVTSEWSRVDVQFLGKIGGGTVRPGIQIATSGDSVEIAIPDVIQGSVPQSHVINTTGSPVTRTADVYKIEGDDFLELGSDLVVNGGFSSASGWSLDANAAISGGKLVLTGSSGLTRQTEQLSSSATYRVSFTVSNYVSGNIKAYLNGANSANVNADGTYAFNIVAGSSNDLVGINPTGATADIDNFAIEQITGGFWNPVEGTMYVEFVPRVVGFNYVYSASDGSASNRIVAQANTANHLFVAESGGTQAQIDAGACVADQLNRVAGSWRENDFQAALDGVAGTADTLGTVPAVDELKLGSRENGLESLNGHIKRFIYFPLHADDLDS